MHDIVYDMTKYLLDRGACPNIMTSLFLTPLSIAITMKNRKVVNLLLKYNAILNISIYNIEMAFRLNATNVIIRLIQHGRIEDLMYASKIAIKSKAKGYEMAIMDTIQRSFVYIKLPTELLNIICTYVAVL
jgi:ankyrin repeat protein